MAYTGPGDIVAANNWWGTRAYSLAKCGTICAQLANAASSPTLTQNFNSLASGDLDKASIDSWIATNSVTTPCLSTYFDQPRGASGMGFVGWGVRPNWVEVPQGR